MTIAHHIVLRERGQLVVPADVRARMNWERGTALTRLRNQLGSQDLVAELIDERREAAHRENA